MGTADLAAAVLRTLAASPGWSVVLAVSQPDRPKGRDLALQPTPVKTAAVALGIPVDQPLKARDPQFLERLRAIAPDLIVVAAYGQLLPQALLDIPKHGCLNVHTSLLPLYRGAAPIQWAMADGRSETGVTIMRMDAGLDTGPVISVASTPIHDSDNGQTLHDRLAEIGGDLLVKTIPGYISGELPSKPQPAQGATLARKITKEDGRIDWHQPAEVLWRRIRAFTPWPGAFCHIPAQPKPKLLKVHAARPVDLYGEPGTTVEAGKGRLVIGCGRGSLELIEVQPEGGKRMDAARFLAGHPVSRLD